MKKYFIITFGCQLNKSDSERVASILEKMNYKPALKPNEADLVVVNMCSVRQSAVDRVYGIPQKLNLKSSSKKRKIKTALTGCILKKDERKLRKYFDFILPIKTLQLWNDFLKNDEYFFYLNQRSPQFNKKFNTKYLKTISKYSNNFSVFIPISTGCNNFCSYCVVPFVRGPLMCRPHKDILKEVKSALKKGAKEIWLLGQNVNDYQSPADKSTKFPELLEMVNNIPGDFWIRFTSPNPKDFSKKLIEKMQKCEKVTEYLNLPLQSGDDRILKKMNRSYTTKQYKNLVKKIRQKIPNINLSTDIIVGFPGETKKHFQNTAKLFKEIKFDMAYIAEYSERPGTLAEKTKDDVSKEEKEKRRKILTGILEKNIFEKNKKYIGKEIEILIIGRKKNFNIGKNRDYKTVKINLKDKKDNLMGNFTKVKITNALTWGLEGELSLPKLVVILGPTSSGKTELAIRLAKKLGGEIVSADSRQIYKEMNIGTAKSTKKEVSKVPHHLIDIISPDKKFNAALYKKMAVKKIQDIQKRGKLPFLVGGTGLYVKAVVENINFPEVAPQKKLRKNLEKKTEEELFEIYKKLDPEGAKFIDKKNKRRLVRAIEVCKITKKSFWEQKKEQSPIFNALQIGIDLPKDKLEKRISKRTEDMLKSGLEKEAKKLIKKYGNIPPLQTIGYQEWFENNKPEKTKESINLHTLQFTKRQMTWFKKNKNIIWIKNYKEAEKLIKKFLQNTL
jgi:tRNA-2-methylthio-N6-dimethylallyladenosine synthase